MILKKNTPRKRYAPKSLLVLLGVFVLLLGTLAGCAREEPKGQLAEEYEAVSPQEDTVDPALEELVRKTMESMIENGIGATEGEAAEGQNSEAGRLCTYQTLYDQVTGVPVIDCLVPEGWTPQVYVNWDNYSKTYPGVAEIMFVNADNTASVLIYTAQSFLESSSYSSYISEAHYDHVDFNIYETYLRYYNAADLMQFYCGNVIGRKATLLEEHPLEPKMHDLMQEAANRYYNNLIAGLSSSLGPYGGFVEGVGAEGTVVSGKYEIVTYDNETYLVDGLMASMGAEYKITSNNVVQNVIAWECPLMVLLITDSESTMEACREDYELIFNNALLRGEFYHVNAAYGRQISNAIMQQLTAENIAMTQSNAQSMLSDYSESSYTSDDWASDWSDFIYDNNNYTTLEGESIKVPTAYDSVYQNGNQIYVGPSGEAPFGWTRLE